MHTSHVLNDIIRKLRLPHVDVLNVIAAAAAVIAAVSYAACDHVNQLLHAPLRFAEGAAEEGAVLVHGEKGEDVALG